MQEGKGTIPRAELREVLTTLGEKFTEAEVAEFFGEAETDGAIDYAQFVKKMMH
jgi:Ca2+-binding EF-hand superfamily protein